MAASHEDISTSWNLDRGTRGGVVFYQRQNARINANHHPNANSGGGDDDVDADDGNDNHDSSSSVVDSHRETIMLPQSTHSLLFTENVLSAPFAFAASVLVVSFLCLGLALWDNLSGSSGQRGGLGRKNNNNPHRNVPANVSVPVRGAQFLSILVTLIMEEEIPTSTYLLRTIPRSSLEGSALGFPRPYAYEKFVFSAIVRLLVGYLFLVNVFLAVIQSDRVLDIFYDMLALQFVALLDDIAFSLAKYDVLGKRLRNAATAKHFRVDFEKRPYLFRKKMTAFTKLLYAFNLLLFAGGLTIVGILQRRGHFLCDSLTITFGDEDVWENSWAETSPGRYESAVLAYSYFNGVYEQVEGETRAGRPIYREVRKSSIDVAPFATKTGALILYCEEEGAWVFMHEKISKSKIPRPEDSDCPWLLRSPETEAYDLLEVSGAWSIWVGVIKSDATLKKTCNGCKSDTECNLNGKCSSGRCNCTSTAEHYGMHCELEEPCPIILHENFNDTWSIAHQDNCEPILEYGRPVYILSNNTALFELTAINEVTNLNDDDIISLAYSGSRWVMVKLPFVKEEKSKMVDFAREFHAYWDRAYDLNSLIISAPTKRSYPVGVDFYRIGERGPQHGPHGVLYPLQEPPGRGAFRCAELDSTILPTWISPCATADHNHWFP